ncbi:MAG: MFS transporter, partial [Calditrichales bacterium]
MGSSQTKTNPYRSWQIKIFSATWLAYVGYYFCRKAFYVVKSPLSDSLGLTAIDLAHLGTAYLVFYMIGQYSSAYFGKRMGPKLMLLTGMGISIVCNFAFGISNGFWTIMLFLAINGLAQGTGWPGCIGSLAYWFKRKQRGSILGVWSTCYQLGSVLATSFAAYMLGVMGWRWSFFGASLVLLVIWIAVALLHPNRPEDVGLEPLTDDLDEPVGVDEKQGLGWTREVYVTIITMGFIYFGIKFLRYALWSWAPFFLSKNFDMAGDNAGYLSTVFDLSGFAGVIFAGFVSDKIFKGRRSFLTF